MLVPYQLPSQNPTCFCCQVVSMIRNAKVLEDQIGQFQGRKRQCEMGVNLSFVLCRQMSPALLDERQTSFFAPTKQH